MKLDLNQHELTELTNKVNTEFARSKSALNQKKQLFRDRAPLYVNINRSDLKVNVNSVR